MSSKNQIIKQFKDCKSPYDISERKFVFDHTFNDIITCNFDYDNGHPIIYLICKDRK